MNVCWLFNAALFFEDAKQNLQLEVEDRKVNGDGGGAGGGGGRLRPETDWSTMRPQAFNQTNPLSN